MCLLAKADLPDRRRSLTAELDPRSAGDCVVQVCSGVYYRLRNEKRLNLHRRFAGLCAATTRMLLMEY